MIADVFIKRPVTAIVISIVIVLVGIISMSVLPIAQYPDITPPTVSITGVFTGADAQTVEQTTTTAIETQVNGTPGMSYMASNSTSSGQSSITVTFDVGTDINNATLDVQNRVGIAQPRRCGDFTDQLGEDFGPHGVLTPFAVHDVLELGMARHRARNQIE